ncbi:MAG: hypothetical protein WDZ49_02115 [Litorilinea sp.]
MSQDARKRPENPLDDVAAEASAGLHGKTVEVTNTSKDRVQGGQVHMKDSAARSVEASALHMEDSAAGSVRGGSLEISESALGLVYGRDVHLKDVNASFVMAQQVQAEQVRTVFLVSGKNEGNIRAMLTPLTAAAFGAGFGIVWFALRTVARRFLKK